MPRPRSAGIECDRSAARTAADCVRGLQPLRPSAYGSDAAIHGQGGVGRRPHEHLRVRSGATSTASEYSAFEIKAGLKTRLYDVHDVRYFARFSTNSCAWPCPPSAIRDIAISSPFSVPVQLSTISPPRPICLLLNFSAEPEIVPSSIGISPPRPVTVPVSLLPSALSVRLTGCGPRPPCTSPVHLPSTLCAITAMANAHTSSAHNLFIVGPLKSHLRQTSQIANSSAESTRAART